MIGEALLISKGEAYHTSYTVMSKEHATNSAFCSAILHLEGRNVDRHFRSRSWTISCFTSASSTARFVVYGRRAVRAAKDGSAKYRY